MSTGGVPVNSRRRDWWRILRDLMRVGIPLTAVARKCNRNATTVRSWADGGEPKESDARIVLALYAKHCPVEYIRHQKQFDIRIEIDEVTEPGENRVLPFV